MNGAESSWLPSAAAAVLAMLSAALILALVRLIRGPSLADRVVALDLMLTIALGAMATLALLTREVAILDAGIVTALIGFLGTVAFAGYVEKGGPR